MAGLLTGKRIIVTGGASGIGRACALKYEEEGARVAVLDLNEAPGGFGLQCDVSSGPAVEQTVEQVAKQFDGIDCIHNNAGISSPSKPLHETTEAEWDALQAVNLKSVYWTTRFGFPHLKKSHGSILNTASMVGLIGQSDHAA